MPGARIHVNVVKADGIVRHDLELRARGTEELVVDPVRQERDRSCLPRNFPQELISGHGAFPVVKGHVTPGIDPVECLLRQAAGDQDRRPLRAHG